MGEIATLVKRPVTEFGSDEMVRSLGVKWYGRGAYIAEEKPAHDLKAQRFEVLENDLIYNDMWARNGSVAIVPSHLHRMVASAHFPTWELDLGRVYPSYLGYFFQTPTFWADCESKSQGSTGRNAITKALFRELQIPLPPLDEQRRIVAHIDALAARISEARGLVIETHRDLNGLLMSIIVHPDGWTPELTPLDELIRLRNPDVSVSSTESYRFAGVYSFGRGVFQGETKSGFEFSYKRLTRLNTNDFVYPKLMAWEGAFGVVPEECDGYVVSPEFPVFEVDTTRILPSVLDIYFRNAKIWPEVTSLSIGTNVRRRRLHPRSFLAYKFPLPPMDVQNKLQKVYTEGRIVNQLQSEILLELDALLPSVLDQAFRGELV